MAYGVKQPVLRVGALGLAYVFITILYVPWLLGLFLGQFKDRLYDEFHQNELFVGKPLLLLYGEDDPLCEAFFIEAFAERLRKKGQKVRCCSCCACVVIVSVWIGGEQAVFQLITCGTLFEAQGGVSKTGA